MLQVALAPCSPFSVTPGLMRDTAALAENDDCALHTHLGRERMTRMRSASRRFGCRPVDYLEDVRLARGPRPGWRTASISTTARSKRLGKAGVGVSHCPTSNAVLASGLCRTRELEAAGVKVGLGVDGSASNDSSNLMEGVRHALMLQPADAMTRRLYASRRAALGDLRLGRAASGATTSARSGSGNRRTWPCSRSTNCAFPARTTRWRRWSCAARIAPTG